jgi:hypothetical protein
MHRHYLLPDELGIPIEPNQFVTFLYGYQIPVLQQKSVPKQTAAFCFITYPSMRHLAFHVQQERFAKPFLGAIKVIAVKGFIRLIEDNADLLVLKYGLGRADIGYSAELLQSSLPVLRFPGSSLIDPGAR